MRIVFKWATSPVTSLDSCRAPSSDKSQATATIISRIATAAKLLSFFAKIERAQIGGNKFYSVWRPILSPVRGTGGQKLNMCNEGCAADLFVSYKKFIILKIHEFFGDSLQLNKME